MTTHIESEDAASPGAPRIVICGAGIVGLSAAYYLAEMGLGQSCTLVERHEVAGAASGKAAGFMALEWNDGSPLGPLSRLSYELHRQLAKQFGEEKIGYRRIHTWLGDPGCVDGSVSRPAWLGEGVWPGSLDQAGTPETTAQVHPKLLCEELASAACRAGVQIHHGAVQGLKFDGAGHCTAVTLGQEDLPCDVVILAMGPWTDQARQWLPKGALPPVFGLRRSSVLFQQSLSAEGCLFHLQGGEFSFYPRPDGTLYMSGVTEDPEDCSLPDDSANVETNEKAAGVIQALASRLCPSLKDATVLRTQSCYMPFAGVGLPLIGIVPGCKGSVLVGTGHGPWGILNGPATGKVLAEMASGKGRTSRSLTADALAAFSPARYSKVSA